MVSVEDGYVSEPVTICPRCRYGWLPDGTEGTYVEMTAKTGGPITLRWPEGEGPIVMTPELLRHLVEVINEMRVRETFTCPRCSRTSYHPQDAAHGYCGACHDFTVETQLGPGELVRDVWDAGDAAGR